VPEALAHAEVFRVRAVELEGARYLPLDHAVRAAVVDPEASIWDDPAGWEARLEEHPLVREARVRRRLPGTLVLEIVEEEPVALVPTPVLEPVDRDGRYLPLDPAAHRLDLPVVRPRAVPDRGRPDEARVRVLARAVDMMRAEPVFHRRVSEVGLDAGGALVVRWGADPEVLFRIDAPVDALRIRRGMAVLEHALEADPGRRPGEIDLRYADQVVVRY
jgi:cell division septal protein FtsQ